MNLKFINNDFILRDSDILIPALAVTASTAFSSFGYPLSNQAQWLASLFTTVIWIGVIAYAIFTILHIIAAIALHVVDFTAKNYNGELTMDPTRVPLTTSINKSRSFLNLLVIGNIFLLYYGQNGLGPAALGLFVVVMVLRRIIKSRYNLLITERLRAE